MATASSTPREASEKNPGFPELACAQAGLQQAIQIEEDSLTKQQLPDLRTLNCLFLSRTTDYWLVLDVEGLGFTSAAKHDEPEGLLGSKRQTLTY